jgi:threonine dehydratase
MLAMSRGQVMIPVFADIEEAAVRIKGFAAVTPVIESPALNALTGGRILIKAECLQRTGSFKFRGAWNMVSRLDKDTQPGGVVAFSSGNHAQGVAAAAQIKGLPAVIVMPSDTPAIKIANTRGYGAEVVTYDRLTQSREEIAAGLMKERKAVMVPPFEHKYIMAGQGTAGLEFAAQAKAMGVVLDEVITPCSGGGLAAGLALAFAALSAQTRVRTAEPEGFDDMARSLASGQRQTNERRGGSICDALLSPSPGELTFQVNSKLLGEGLVVSDAEAASAVRFAFEKLKLVIEPGGAVALATVLTGKVKAQGRNIGIVASGGNVDAELYARIIQEAAAISV